MKTAIRAAWHRASFLGLMLLLPPSAFAAQNVTVVITPSCQNFNGTGTDVVVLAPSGGTLTCGPYTIQPRSSGDAKVVVGTTDGNNDTLTLQNAKITKNSASAQDIQITLEADTYAPLPSNAPPDVGYQISASGYFRRGSISIATGDDIRYSGFVDPNTGAGYKPLDPASPQYTYTVSNNNNIQNPSPPVNEVLSTLNSPRKLKGEMWSKLRDPQGTTKDSLHLVALQVTNFQPGGPPPPCPECTRRSELSFTCMTTSYSSWRALGCPDCVTDDGLVAQAAKVTLFAKSNWENLSQDMARGEGEHLGALATLLGVPDDRQAAFFGLAQEEYASRAGLEAITPDGMIAALQEHFAGSQVVVGLSMPPVN